MAKVSELYPSPWLRAEDLQGMQRKVRVESVEIAPFKNFDGEKELKPVLSFVGKSKKLILNKKQAFAMALAAGDDTDTWVGSEVYLQPQTTPQGKQTIVILPVVAAVAEGF